MRLKNNFRSGVGIFSGDMPTGGERLEARLSWALLIMWMLPALLSVIQGESAVRSFLSDSALHTRSLVAVPVLILGEYFSLPFLRRIAGHFRSLIPEDEHNLIEAYSNPVLSARMPPVVIAVSIVCAYAAVLILIRYVPLSSISVWQRTSGEGFQAFSPAGWWNVLVSIPVALSLFFLWVWRLSLWSRFLWRISKLHLLLIPSHPDRLAGLGFLGKSPVAFIPLSIAVSAILAGMIANRVLLLGESVIRYRDLLIGLAIVVSVLFSAPLMILAGRLVSVRRYGIIAYSGLARRVGRSFEEKWINDSNGGPLEGALQAPDFSATTDLYEVVKNVYSMRIVPLDLRSLAVLIVATLIPFLPVALLQLPFRTVVQKLAALLI